LADIGSRRFVDQRLRFGHNRKGRRDSEMKLRWSYLQGDAIEVPRTDTKNRKPSSIVITDELSKIIARRRKARVPGCDLIFHNEGAPLGIIASHAQRVCTEWLGRFPLPHLSK
jgi:hypothetical protein